MKTLVRLGMVALLTAIGFACAGCHPWVFHPVNANTRGWDSRSKAPFVYVRLGQSQQICLPERAAYAPVDIFVSLYNLPAQEVIVVVNDGAAIRRLYGTEVQLHLTKVGPGEHQVEVYVEGYKKEPVVLSWTVLACAPQPEKELYKPDGRGLKGYCDCPTPEPCPTPEEN